MPYRNKFMFATGIENSYPTIQLPDGSTKRIDEMEKCCHYKNWQRDFELVRGMWGYRQPTKVASPVVHFIGGLFMDAKDLPTD